MNRSTFLGLLTVVAAAGLLLSQEARAASLENISVLGSTDGVNYYSSLSNLTVGETIDYEVVGQLAPVGTSNGTKSITSLTDHPTASTSGYDGLNNIGLNLSETAAGSFASGALYTDSGANGSDYALSASATSGTVSSTAVTGIIGGLPAGYFEGANVQAVVYTGTFTVAASGTVGAAYSGAGAGFEFNSNPSTGTDTLANKVSIGSSDTNGYLGFNALTLSVGGVGSSPVPAPSTMLASIVAVATLCFVGLIRRRTNQLA